MSVNLTEAVALGLVEQGVKAFDELDIASREEVTSIVLYGSLVRGDFVTNVSDIDILLVFNTEPTDRIVEEVQKCFTDVAVPYRGKSNCPEVFDIPWVFVSELPLKNATAKESHLYWKFLEIFAFDFVAHSEVLRGEDFRQKLNVKDPKTLIQSRAEDLRNKWSKFKADKKHWMVVIITGELIRLAQIKFGERTIDKRVVYQNFKKHVPYFDGKEFIDVFWNEYLTGGLDKMNPSRKKAYFAKCESFNEQLFELLED